MAEICNVSDQGTCEVGGKEKRLEEEVNELRRQNSSTHERIFDRISEIDKRLTIQENQNGDVKENRNKLEAHTQAISKLETLYNSLEGLPSTIANLDKTITIIGTNLESMDKNLSEIKKDVSSQGGMIERIREENQLQSEKILKVDNKGKVDWIEFITKNFWKVLAIFGAIYVVVKYAIERGV